MASFGLRTQKKRKVAEPLPIFTANNDDDSCGEISGSADFRQSQEAQDQGNTLASEGRFSSALTCFDAAIRLIPAASCSTMREATLHELRAQVLLEMGDRHFEAVCAATRATELASEWPDGYLTLGRCQLNLGEPSMAVRSLSTALELNPDLSLEVKDDLERATALHRLVQESGADGRVTSRGSSSLGSSSDFVEEVVVSNFK